MKIFTPTSGGNSKTNFVDENNVFVGFDTSQSCCEDAGYFFTKTKPVPDVEIIDADKIDGDDFPGYNFDTSFNEGELYPDHDGGGSVTFRLIDGESEMFLTLYNHHNGYYEHGWEMKSGGENGKELSAGYM